MPAKARQFTMAGLKPLGIEGLKSLPGLGTVGGVEVSGKVIDTEQVFRQHLTKHSHTLHLGSKNAAKALDRLPDLGESIHILMSGNFAGWDYVSAILALAEPAVIDELYVSTLGFSERNGGQLLELLDSGKVGRVWFLCSDYMRKVDAHIYEPLKQALEGRGHKIKAARNHAKILAFALSDGSKISLDGSMNLRSCKNVEQVNITNSPDLFQFWSGYIREATEGGQ